MPSLYKFAFLIVDTITADMRCINRILNSSDPAVRHLIEDIQETEEQEWDALGNDYEFVWNDIPINANDSGDGPFSCAG